MLVKYIKVCINVTKSEKGSKGQKVILMYFGPEKASKSISEHQDALSPAVSSCSNEAMISPSCSLSCTQFRSPQGNLQLHCEQANTSFLLFFFFFSLMVDHRAFREPCIRAQLLSNCLSDLQHQL